MLYEKKVEKSLTLSNYCHPILKENTYFNKTGISKFGAISNPQKAPSF